MLQPQSLKNLLIQPQKRCWRDAQWCPKAVQKLGIASGQRIDGKEIIMAGVRVSAFLSHGNKRTSARVGMFVSPLFQRNEYFLSSPTDFDS